MCGPRTNRIVPVALGIAAGAVAGRGAAQERAIAPAPAFNAERLSTLPRDEWLTNGRNEMPAFGAVMSQDDLRDVATYLLEELLRR